ncbi:MAG: hypothetical protein LE180_05310 [Endomicrobium sp.]|uniref:hypothetical protein n=1 Tax=Candidatus Endomicrobiellum pyrsonymphae TaxID=1408203 RepID=UPI00357B0869|nr:hypothetical protein [Endomicrobium sp.]
MLCKDAGIYDYALENFKLTENLSSKIVPNNFSISNNDEILDIEYSFKNANAMSTKTSSNHKDSFNISTTMTTVMVKNINYYF